MSIAEIKEFLDEKVHQYNQQNFVADDPISIPHLFSKKEDIEIIGFLVATIAWGNRKSIIKNAHRLVEIMEGQPHEYILDYTSSKEVEFVHRTFNSIDLDFFFRSLNSIYHKKGGLEKVFSPSGDTKSRIVNFRQAFISTEHETRSLKHIADPNKGSSAKRINMFLRWMIRKDKKGVDFGIWKNHKMSELYVPLDVHTGISARKLNLITRNANDWKSLEELMFHLKTFCPEDPCKYDFALFGLSVNKEI